MSILRTTALLGATAAAAALVSPAAALATTSAGTGATPGGDNATPTGHTTIISDCIHRRVEPRRVISACGDAGEYAVVRHYSSWTKASARGRGFLVINDCTPNCASGRFHHYPARFHLTAVRTPPAGPVFSRIQVRFVQNGHVRHTTLFPPTRPLA